MIFLISPIGGRSQFPSPGGKSKDKNLRKTHAFNLKMKNMISAA
jgi:hypothetical protein